MWEHFLLQILKFLILKKVWFCPELFGNYCSPKMCKFRGTRTLEEPGPQRTQDPQRSVSIHWKIGENICHIYTYIIYNTTFLAQKIHIGLLCYLKDHMYSDISSYDHPCFLHQILIYKMLCLWKSVFAWNHERFCIVFIFKKDMHFQN